MDLWHITVAALRRWYVLLPLLALTGLAVITAGDSIAPEYEAQTSAMIMPERVEGPVPNPYGGTDQAVSALGIVLNSVDSRTTIEEQGLASDYEVGAQNRSTIFQLTVRADSPDVAEQTGAAVIELARQELTKRQTDVGLLEASQYTVSVLEPPTVTDVVQTGKTRIQAIIGVLGAGISLLIAVLFDDIVGLIRRFRAKRADHDDDETSGELDLPTVPTGEAVDDPYDESPNSRAEPSPALAGSQPETVGDGELTPDDDDSLEPSHSSGQRQSSYEAVRRP